MMVGAGSYGNYIKPHPGTSYQITLQIQRPATQTVETKFEYKFD